MKMENAKTIDEFIELVRKHNPHKVSGTLYPELRPPITRIIDRLFDLSFRSFYDARLSYTTENGDGLYIQRMYPETFVKGRAIGADGFSNFVRGWLTIEQLLNRVSAAVPQVTTEIAKEEYMSTGFLQSVHHVANQHQLQPF